MFKSRLILASTGLAALLSLSQCAAPTSDGGTGTAGTGAGPGAGGSTGQTGGDSGCACDVTGARGNAASAFLLLAIVIGARRRRAS